MRTTMTLVLSLTLSTLCLAVRQDASQTAKAPLFEVSSVRQNTSGVSKASTQWFPGRFSSVNARLDMLILEAFAIPQGLAQVQLAGGLRLEMNCLRNCSSRDEILSARFDIQATLPPGLPTAQRPLALRAFLEDRFKLKAHLATDNREVYALTVAREGRLGPRLRRSKHNCMVWAREREQARAQGASIPSQPIAGDGKPACGGGNMSRIGDFVYVRRSAGEISALVTAIRGDWPFLIVDRTGLEGNFEWDLTSALPGISETNLKQNAPTLDIALQEQLGLRLVKTNAPLDVLVIDSVSMPTPN